MCDERLSTSASRLMKKWDHNTRRDGCSEKDKDACMGPFIRDKKHKLEHWNGQKWILTTNWNGQKESERFQWDRGVRDSQSKALQFLTLYVQWYQTTNIKLCFFAHLKSNPLLKLGIKMKNLSEDHTLMAWSCGSPFFKVDPLFDATFHGYKWNHWPRKANRIHMKNFWYLI